MTYVIPHSIVISNVSHPKVMLFISGCEEFEAGPPLCVINKLVDEGLVAPTLWIV